MFRMWINLDEAAKELGTPIRTLRRLVEASPVGPDGFTRELDGVTFRKLGGRWKANLGTWRLELPSAGIPASLDR